MGSGPFFLLSSIDHHRTDPVFATASNIVQIWDESKYAARTFLYALHLSIFLLWVTVELRPSQTLHSLPRLKRSHPSDSIYRKHLSSPVLDRIGLSPCTIFVLERLSAE